ncbi:hypothetical protein [Novosphingobium pentaromativorans]|uniref:hypothetical protein n=1 Tax=Novosphingobium pentaromativorans TaxID=205844 RepID=UPI0019399E70|nr:hypothetical protein [Novosphingobium pentaromativorans]
MATYSASASSYTAFCLNGMYDKRCDDVTCTLHECNEPPNIHIALRKQLIAFLHEFRSTRMLLGIGDEKADVVSAGSMACLCRAGDGALCGDCERCRVSPA